MQLLQRLIDDDERFVLHLVLQGPDSFRGTIDHHDGGAALGGQVLNHQPPHLARAHDEHSGGQHAGTRKLSEGQLDRGGADGDGTSRDVGLAADAFAGLDGVFEEAIDDFAEGGRAREREGGREGGWEGTLRKCIIAVDFRFYSSL